VEKNGAHGELALPVELTVNGQPYSETAASRSLLVLFLRDQLGVKSVNFGCDTGNCGACTVLWNGKLIKSCMMLAVQAAGSEITTVEGLAAPEEDLHPIQQAFAEHHGLQCGYCTPGMLLSVKYLLERNPNPTNEEIRRGIKGNICRCTGYENIVTAVRAVAAAEKEPSSQQPSSHDPSQTSEKDPVSAAQRASLPEDEVTQ
jgi:aerobic carbon-monoxide dehydrogenase small subunit